MTRCPIYHLSYRSDQGSGTLRADAFGRTEARILAANRLAADGYTGVILGAIERVPGVGDHGTTLL